MLVDLNDTSMDDIFDEIVCCSRNVLDTSIGLLF